MSTKTIADKLVIKSTTPVWLSDAAHRDRLGPLPEGTSIVDSLEQAAVALYFAGDRASLRALLDTHKDHLTCPVTTWIAYPKANRTDINRDTLWPIVADYGLRPNGQVAIDEVWSALRFRLSKPGETPFLGGEQA